MTPALLALDVDGTLADPDGVIRPRTKAAIATARARGVHVVVATGRPWRVAERTVGDIGGAGWAVCSNGAMTVRVDDSAVLRNVFLPDGEAERIVDALRTAVPGVGLGLEFERGSKSEAGWAHRLPPGVPLGPPVDDVLDLLADPRPVRRVIAFHDDHDDDIAGLATHATTAIGDVLEVAVAGLPFISIGPPGINKAVAMAALCDDLGVDVSDVLAFGDEANDKEMLAWAGRGVAMGNATEPALEVADEVTTSNDDDGVAVYLERIFQ